MSVAAHAAPRETRNPFAGTGRWLRGKTRQTLTAAAAGARRLQAHGGTIRSVILQTAGLGALSTAAWMVAMPAGVATIGLSCFVLNFLMSGDTQDEQR